MFVPRRAMTASGHTAPWQPLALLVLALSAFCSSLALLGGCSVPTNSKSAVPAPIVQAQSVRQMQMHVARPPTISTSELVAQSHLYRFASSDVGLMQPTVDAQGNVWVGEMNANSLARLNSQTGVVTGWTPPGAEDGIMTTTLDAQGNAWFAEQNANYIGRFDKKQETFHIFPLGTWKGSPLGPQDLHFDSKGMLWFTGQLAGVIGQLDPSSGAIRIWPVSLSTAGTPSYPYCLTVASDGRIWFGDFSGGAIGSLDPATGKVALYDLPDPQEQVFSMGFDTTGRLWFTEVLPGKLGMFDPETDTLTELPVPTVSGTPPALYELVIDHQDAVWFVDVGANTLVRYLPGKQTLTFLRLSLSSSVPFGLTLDPAGNLWFTAGSSSANYVGEMAP